MATYDEKHTELTNDLQIIDQEINDVLENIKKMFLEYSNPELAKLEGHVYQVFNDGEITLQKSGSLLGQRSMNIIENGLTITIPAWIKIKPKELEIDSEDNDVSIYCTEIHAYEIHYNIIEYFSLSIKRMARHSKFKFDSRNEA